MTEALGLSSFLVVWPPSGHNQICPVDLTLVFTILGNILDKPTLSKKYVFVEEIASLVVGMSVIHSVTHSVRNTLANTKDKQGNQDIYS